jgi:HlyD family secretion protein
LLPLFLEEAAIVISEQDDVLTVPGSALFRRDGDWHVFAVEASEAVLRAVAPGQRSSEYAEVLDGLEENDQVIIFPSDLVRDGVQVQGTDG